MESEPEGNDFDVDNEPTMPEQGKRKLRKE
jgi:hypothetical protein